PYATRCGEWYGLDVCQLFDDSTTRCTRLEETIQRGYATCVQGTVSKRGDRKGSTTHYRNMQQAGLPRKARRRTERVARKRTLASRCGRAESEAGEGYCRRKHDQLNRSSGRPVI